MADDEEKGSPGYLDESGKPRELTPEKMEESDKKAQRSDFEEETEKAKRSRRRAAEEMANEIEKRAKAGEEISPDLVNKLNQKTKTENPKAPLINSDNVKLVLKERRQRVINQGVRMFSQELGGQKPDPEERDRLEKERKFYGKLIEALTLPKKNN